MCVHSHSLLYDLKVIYADAVYAVWLCVASLAPPPPENLGMRLGFVAIDFKVGDSCDMYHGNTDRLT